MDINFSMIKSLITRFIHQLLNPNYFPIFYECANPPIPVLTFCPRFLIKSPFYESFLMETQRENGRNIDFLMTGHIPPSEVFRPLVRITKIGRASCRERVEIW